MPIENLDELRSRIAAANLTWRVREVPDDEEHGLGADEPLPDDGLAAAEQLGQVLMSELRLDNPAFTDRLRINDLWKHFKIRPSHFDWRDRGVIGAVTNQRHCGSCVSFATAGLVAAQAAIELNIHDLDLSEADQHFNSSHGAHCGGWNNHDSLDQVRLRGIANEATFPYLSAFDSPPQDDPNRPDVWLAHSRAEVRRSWHTYKITNFTAHTGDERKTYLSTVGPMICGFTVYEDFDKYDGGPFTHVWGKKRGGHAVLVVGYDDRDSTWICRNSWGAGFGGAADPDGSGAGFFKLTYGDCNIDNEPFYGCTGVITPKPFKIVLTDRVRVDRPIPVPFP